jgi:RNA polymerase sigma-70 factor (ECF subfamily)
MAMQSPITDEQVTALVSRCQQGEASATEALYDLYADRLYRYLRARIGDADLAADLTTDVFVRMIGHIGGFRLNRDRPAASFSAWLYRIAANLAADQHRRRQRIEQVSFDEDLPGVGSQSRSSRHRRASRDRCTARPRDRRSDRGAKTGDHRQVC